MDFIFDIDGTLADVSHRQHHITAAPKDWKAFQAAAHLDPCHEPVAVMVRALWRQGERVILCTGRGEQERPATVAWLRENEIFHDRLYMRAEGDHRHDDVIKAELLDRMRADGFDPKLAFDDRDRCVRLWRAKGLICAQVAEGDF